MPKVRLPDQDFTFWIDGDGLPQYRGETSRDAVATVQELVEFCHQWVALMQEPDDAKRRKVKERELSKEISELPLADQNTLKELQRVAAQLKGVAAVKIDHNNIDQVLSVSTNIQFNTKVQRLLIRWASMHL